MTDQPIRILVCDRRPETLAQVHLIAAQRAGQWQVAFARSCEEALEALEREPADVLVATVEDAAADTVQVLEQVRVRHPRVARIALSDRANRTSVAASLGAIHRHLGRLCEASVLAAAVEQACTFSRMLATDEVRALVGRLRSVPSPGVAVSRVLAELNSPTASAASLAEIIAGDPALTTQLLRVVNSPVFGLAHQVTSPFTAVTLLGFDTVGAVCVSSRLLGGVDRRALVRAGLTSLFSHSVRTADLARIVTMEVGADETDAGTAYAAGVLHDVGKLVLAAEFDGPWNDVLATASAADRREAEAARFGVTHDRLGGYLLGLWGVPIGIVEAVAFHHDPSAHPSAHFTTLTAVHVANALAHLPSTADVAAAWPAAGLDADHLARIGLPIDHPAWSGIAREVAHAGNRQRAGAAGRR